MDKSYLLKQFSRSLQKVGKDEYTTPHRFYISDDEKSLCISAGSYNPMYSMGNVVLNIKNGPTFGVWLISEDFHKLKTELETDKRPYYIPSEVCPIKVPIERISLHKGSRNNSVIPNDKTCILVKEYR